MWMVRAWRPSISPQGPASRFMDVEHHGGEWRNDLLLGSSNLAATEFYQPLGDTHLFVAPYAFASKYPRNEFNGETRIGIFGDERAGGGFDFGSQHRPAQRTPLGIRNL